MRQDLLIIFFSGFLAAWCSHNWYY
ncbi:hypothetical protein [Salmonella enterica]